jgi:undecaprenyl-diphosphatase
MSILQAIILAIIEGLTEFLPVSSTGHMIIGSSMMGIADDSFTKLFTVSIQFGAILSVVVIYRKRFFPDGMPVKTLFNFYRRLFIAFLPALAAGIAFGSLIRDMLGNVLVVAGALLIGGVIFILIDKWFHRAEESGTGYVPSDKKALKIGLFQIIAMIPGVSRSAATIIGGLSQGLNKKAAAEFSFFLAVPTMLAATVKDLYDYANTDIGITQQEVLLLVIGSVVAFIVAILAIRSFVAYLTKHGFKIFGYYRIIVGLAIIVLHALGYDLTIV